MQLAAVERFGLEGDDCRVARLGAANVDFATQLHPGDGEDGAGVRTGQCEGVLLVVLQQVKTACETYSRETFRELQLISFIFVVVTELF